MNGRLYDPVVHRFMQPDNFVQDPFNTQNFNRYSYVMNNPFVFKDNSGEFFFSFLTAPFEALYNVVTHGVNFKNYDFQITNRSWKIDLGLFQGNFGQILSRFSWELPQSLLGYVTSGVSNLIGDAKEVAYYDGATVLTHKSSNWGAFTLGSFINGDSSIKADANNRLFQHEYGHYLQSQVSGLFYLGKYALPSVFSKGEHRLHPAEQDANSRAFTYFNKHIENYGGWQWQGNNGNIIVGYNFSLPFNNPSNQLALSNALNNLNWSDYLLYGTIGTPGLGIYNIFNQNKKQ